MSWDQLLSITKEAKERGREEAARPALDCPNDGTPLIENDKGRKRCPFCGWSPIFQVID